MPEKKNILKKMDEKLKGTKLKEAWNTLADASVVKKNWASVSFDGGDQNAAAKDFLAAALSSKQTERAGVKSLVKKYATSTYHEEGQFKAAIVANSEILASVAKEESPDSSSSGQKVESTPSLTIEEQWANTQAKWNFVSTEVSAELKAALVDLTKIKASSQSEDSEYYELREDVADLAKAVKSQVDLYTTKANAIAKAIASKDVSKLNTAISSMKTFCKDRELGLILSQFDEGDTFLDPVNGVIGEIEALWK